jgi:hypothetical protein
MEKIQTQTITTEMLENLPAPIQRYMNYTGVVGKAIPQSIELKYIGKFRQNAEQPWMPMVAKQRYTTDPASFEWQAKFQIMGIPLLRVTDRYENGKGSMLGKLAGFFTIFDAKDHESLDQGAMMRYLNEVMWFPTAYFSKKFTWQAIDDGSVQVTYTDFGMSISTRLFIDDEGKLTNFIGKRYRELNGEYFLDKWSTPITGYGEFNGLRLPKHGNGTWLLPEGDLTYIKLDLQELNYTY